MERVRLVGRNKKVNFFESIAKMSHGLYTPLTLQGCGLLWQWRYN